MKGADQCPRCASRKWADVEQPVTDFYARTLRVCGNCTTAWEPFEQATLLDKDDPRSSFLEPCNNCAFRPGSPEQQDRERWRDLMTQLGAGGSFYCHKGVPVDLEHEHGDSGFAYPDQGKTPSKLRICRGYLNMLGKRLDKMVQPV